MNSLRPFSLSLSLSLPFAALVFPLPSRMPSLPLRYIIDKRRPKTMQISILIKFLKIKSPAIESPDMHAHHRRAD